MTARTDIARWISEAKAEGASHLLVVCDTFDWTDHPVTVMPGDDMRDMAARHSGPNMTKLMEVYDLREPIEPQLAEYRAMNFGEPR